MKTGPWLVALAVSAVVLAAFQAPRDPRTKLSTVLADLVDAVPQQDRDGAKVIHPGQPGGSGVGTSSRGWQITELECGEAWGVHAEEVLKEFVWRGTVKY